MVIFTDADIIFSKYCLGKALTYISKNGLDHLCLLFPIIGGSLPYRIYFTYWSIGIIWLITTQKHLGVAFNLIKKSVYKAIGTHKACIIDKCFNYFFHLYPMVGIFLGNIT